MLTVNHVPVGAVVGLIARKHPLYALALGVLSHLALDAIPHWGISEPGRYDEFTRVAERDGLAGLAASALLIHRAPPSARPAVAAGIIGAVAPDFDHVTTYFFNRTIWPPRFLKFHGDIQREGATPMRKELTRAAISTGVALCVLGLAARKAREVS